MAAPTVVLIVALAAAASVAIWASVLVRWLRGETILPAHDARPPAWSPVAVCLTLGLLGVHIAARLGLFGRADPTRVPSLEAVQQNCLAYAAILAVLLLVLAHATGRGLADFGLRRQGWPQQLAVGGLAFLASIVPVLILLLATAAWRRPETQHPLLQLLAENQQFEAILWIGLAAVVAAPLVEELTYRVILQGTAERLLPPAVAIVAVAVVFSMVHNPVDVLPLIPLALILGYVYHRTRSYLAVATAHALFNLSMLLLALASRDAIVPPDSL